jgi:hypothetical protein
LACAAASLLPVGCVQRRLLIRSDPPGAIVYVDNERVGTTPCAVNYVYYGTRKIRLVKDGFETLEIKQPLPTPWYQIPPLDFASDVLVPHEIRDVRGVTYRLQPQFLVPPEELLARAESLRRETQQGTTLPASPPLPHAVAPGAQTLPAAGQAIDLDAQFPVTPAETLPPGGIEYVP